MIETHRPAAVGFHRGELAVQRQAGVQAQATRLAGMVARGELRAGMAAFAAQASFAAITARDRAGRLWTSPLLGSPGFMRAVSPTTLQIDVALPAADPLYDLPSGQPAGLIIIDFATRRRVRINGVLTETGHGTLTLDVDQAYGNCPQYIQRRKLDAVAAHAGSATPLYAGNELQESHIRLIEAADTFFLGTTHPASGNDASHRGGPPGFVHATQDRVRWPDYPGNNMFNSFGNLAEDPTAALLFVDFLSGVVLQLSGSGAVRWDHDADEAGTGRQVEFTPAKVIAYQGSSTRTDRP